MAAGLALVGAILIASYPAARYFASREHRDIARAGSEIFSTPLAGLPTTTDLTFEVRVPDDRQWRRIEDRLQAPALVLIAVSRAGRPAGYPHSVAGLRARVWRNGTEQEMRPITAMLYAAEGEGLELTANRGDRLTMNLRRDFNTAPSDAVVILAPNWTAPTLGAWGEGAAAGDLLAVGAIVLAMIGVVCLLWALTFLWGRPTFPMPL
jgi:hypothetical protein